MADQERPFRHHREAARDHRARRGAKAAPAPAAEPGLDGPEDAAGAPAAAPRDVAPPRPARAAGRGGAAGSQDRRKAVMVLVAFAYVIALAVAGTAVKYALHGVWLKGGGILAATVAMIIYAAVLASRRSAAMEPVYLRRAIYAAAWLAAYVPLAWSGWPLTAVYAAPFVACVLCNKEDWHHAGQPPAADEPDPPQLPAEEPPLQLEPPPPPPPTVDARQALFETRFCGTGDKFPAAQVSDFTLLDQDGATRGFTFKVTFDEFRDNAGTVTELTSPATMLAIARLYHVTAAAVTADYDRTIDPHNPSEIHGTVTVMKTYPRTATTAKAWDPRVSTYNKLTGAFEIGDFPMAPAHWRILAPPRGGAIGGAIAGRPGKGKTTAANIILTQSGLIMDDGRRLCGLLVGDPQKMPFATWRGYADVSAVGRYATIHLLRMAAGISRSRADWIGTMKRTDNRGREWEGQTYWQASRVFPAIGVVIDELPMITAAELGDYAAEAIELMSVIVREARKTGVYLVLLTQTPDLQQFGKREIRDILSGWNVLGFKSLKASTDMIGLKVDPFLLPEEPGIAYFASVDDMARTQMRLRWLEDEADEGVDLRELVEMVAAGSVDWDEGFLRVMEPMGFTGPGWTFYDGDVPSDIAGLQGSAVAAAPAGTTLLEVTRQQGFDHGSAMQAVADTILGAGPDGIGMWDLSSATGLDALAITSVTAILTTKGLIRDLGDRWAGRGDERLTA